MGYVDADGHVIEIASEIATFLEPPFNDMPAILPITPVGDLFHGPNMTLTKLAPGTFVPADADKWLAFIDKTGTDWSVLYPTLGLFFGRVLFPDWAVAYARAYNSWLYDRFLSVSPRLKAVALLPMQDVPSAVEELKRAVTEFGMVGGMIPSNGLLKHIGAKEYWPLYRAAEELDCVLAVHGGNYEHLGFDTMTDFPTSRALGMPIPLMNGMAGMMIEGVLDEFPNLRVGFMEGGTAWIPLLIDRLEREREYGAIPLQREPLEYFQQGRIFVGCEGNEKSLAYAIDRVGPEPFMFASDFPHEISIDNAMEEINEILTRDDLLEAHKTLILQENARKFYKQ